MIQPNRQKKSTAITIFWSSKRKLSFSRDKAFWRMGWLSKSSVYLAFYPKERVSILLPPRHGNASLRCPILLPPRHGNASLRCPILLPPRGMDESPLPPASGRRSALLDPRTGQLSCSSGIKLCKAKRNLAKCEKINLSLLSVI